MCRCCSGTRFTAAPYTGHAAILPPHDSARALAAEEDTSSLCLSRLLQFTLFSFYDLCTSADTTRQAQLHAAEQARDAAAQRPIRILPEPDPIDLGVLTQQTSGINTGAPPRERFDSRTPRHPAMPAIESHSHLPPACYSIR